ncbi:MAG: hypothetical protein ACRD2P_07325 [Terriglobia bacterium]
MGRHQVFAIRPPCQRKPRLASWGIFGHCGCGNTGLLGGASILTMMRPAGRDSRWRLLPLNRREHVFKDAFQYVCQLGFVLLACAVVVTARICEQDVNAGIWLVWVALATVFWASFVRSIYRSLGPTAGVLLAAACASAFAAVASSTAVSRTAALVSSLPERWQPKFWSLVAATVASTLVALAAAEALRRLSPALRARRGLTLRFGRIDHRRWLTIWLKHEWNCWSGCLYPYVAILISAPFLYYLCLNRHPSLIASFIGSSFVLLIDGVPLTNILGRERTAGMDRLSTMPIRGSYILDIQNSGILLTTGSIYLAVALLIAARFGIRAGLGNGLMGIGIILGQLTLGGLASTLWARHIRPYGAGGGGSLTLAFSLLLVWGMPTILGVLFAEGQVALRSLMLLSACYAIAYWLCRPRAGRLLETKLWSVRARIRREEF